MQPSDASPHPPLRGKCPARVGPAIRRIKWQLFSILNLIIYVIIHTIAAYFRPELH